MKSNYLFLVLMCLGCSETFVVKGEGGDTSMDTGGSGGIENSGGTPSSGGVIETGGTGSGGIVNTGGASMDTGGSGGTGTECSFETHYCIIKQINCELFNGENIEFGSYVVNCRDGSNGQDPSSYNYFSNTYSFNNINTTNCSKLDSQINYELNFCCNSDVFHNGTGKHTICQQ